MKDIINLNAKETNIAIVWAVLFVLFFCVKIETEVSNINMMPIYVQVPLVFMHWFWVGDMFAPLKRKCPFIMTLIAIFGRVVRYSFVLIFLFLAIYVLLQDSLQILITLYFGMVGLYFLFLFLSALRIKIRCIKNKEPYPIAIGYKNISSDIKIYHFILGFILLLLIFPLTFFPDED